jgi:hypothetical protein
MGAPPVEWWLGDYMAHLKTPYYVGLLSAAALHGSAHFAVMETQVVVPGAMSPLSVGRAHVRFFVKSTVTAAPVETRSNLWGAVEVSTPEATLLDLLRYIGSIERTALIVGDLAKNCRPAKPPKGARRGQRSPIGATARVSIREIWAWRSGKDHREVDRDFQRAADTY